MDNDSARTRRFRISHATVVAYLALFVAMGGTATAVTYVVSSNSQLGPGTVSGSKPTTGKHDNIINGTVNGADIADNSLGGADIDESKVGRVPNARKLNGHGSAYYGRVIPFGVKNLVAATVLATVKGLTVRASCDPFFTAIVFKVSSAATVSLFHIDNTTSGYENSQALTANESVEDDANEGVHLEGQAIYRRNSDGAVVTVAYHLNQANCEVIGTVMTSG